MAIKEIRTVKWIDSMIVDRFDGSEKPLGICTIESVGIVVDETDKWLAIARDEHDGVWRGIVVIPKIAILEQNGVMLTPYEPGVEWGGKAL